MPVQKSLETYWRYHVYSELCKIKGLNSFKKRIQKRFLKKKRFFQSLIPATKGTNKEEKSNGSFKQKEFYSIIFYSTLVITPQLIQIKSKNKKVN